MKKLWLAWVMVMGCTSLIADDWPHWLGAGHDAVWYETGIIREIPAQGLKVKWRSPISGGYSGPAVAGGKVFVTDYQRNSGDPTNGPSRRAKLTGTERIRCLDAETGKEIWTHQYDCPYEVSYPAGPRATPAVDAGRVYSLGTEGNLLCLESKTGKVIWKKELKTAYKLTTPIWGFCSHPMIYGDLLYLMVGGKGTTVVAFDKHTGAEVWSALDSEEAGYCPVTLIEAAGIQQLIVWTPTALHGMNPKNGELYWKVALQPAYGMSVVAPRKYGEFLFASGIGTVGVCLKLDSTKPAVTEVWRGTSTTGVYCSNSTPIIENGIIYGVGCRKGELQAVQLETGKRIWESYKPTTGQRPQNHGTAFLTRNEERYFLFNEQGELVIAELSPAGYKEWGRAKLLQPTGEAFGRPVVWSAPAFANRCVFVRNDKEIICVDLTAK